MTQPEPTVERLGGTANQMGWCHGLLCAFDSLYVTVGEKNDTTEAGLYRLQDTDGDDQYDTKEKIITIDTHGEHGAHNVVVGPDQQWLYMICGNGTPRSGFGPGGPPNQHHWHGSLDAARF